MPSFCRHLVHVVRMALDDVTEGLELLAFVCDIIVCGRKLEAENFLLLLLLLLCPGMDIIIVIIISIHHITTSAHPSIRLLFVGDPRGHAFQRNDFILSVVFEWEQSKRWILQYSTDTVIMGYGWWSSSQSVGQVRQIGRS